MGCGLRRDDGDGIYLAVTNENDEGKIAGMIYLVGTLGFVSGFILGQFILFRILRDVPKEELLENKSLHWKFGLLNWLIALLTAASAVWLYHQHFSY